MFIPVRILNIILKIKNPYHTCPYPDNQESWIYLSLSWQSRILNIPVLILTIKNPKYTCPNHDNHPDNQESWLYLPLSRQSRILNIPVLILTIKNPDYTCPNPDNHQFWLYLSLSWQSSSQSQPIKKSLLVLINTFSFGILVVEYSTYSM